jgi:N-acetyl-anhydromuramyl-L-alanine amidase AmpD
MRVSKITEQEVQFSDKLINTSRVKYTDIGTYEIGYSSVRQIRPKYDSYYYNTENKKDLIVLHSTAGTLRADMASLTAQDNHVSVSYVIARSGDIYELFDPKYWSYHLGKGSVGGNRVNSARSIGIELSNYGPLIKKGENLETIYSQLKYTDSNGVEKKSKKDVYCNTSDVDEYTIVDDEFRGYKYFASFTDEQYIALSDLLDYLCKEFDIPKTFIDEDERFNVFSSASEAKSYKGICTHVNYRKSGKWDLGPDFNWDRLMSTEIEFDEVEIKPEAISTSIDPVVKTVSIKSTVKPEVTPGVHPYKRFNFVAFIVNIVDKLFGK